MHGDFTRVQAKLGGQAEALDAIFHHLTHRALDAEVLSQFEAFLRLALKAQAQSKVTFEAAVHLRTPKAAQFIRQQNVALNQQVNNGQGPQDHHDSQRAERTFNSGKPTELLEGPHEEEHRMDAGNAGSGRLHRFDGGNRGPVPPDLELVQVKGDQQ